VFVINAKVCTPRIAPQTAHISCCACHQRTTSIFCGQTTSSVQGVGGNAAIVVESLPEVFPEDPVFFVGSSLGKQKKEDLPSFVGGARYLVSTYCPSAVEMIDK
jgi:hypothetical protein